MTAKIYLVGGACRDMILGRTPKDYDYVVVGGTEQEMLDKGFVRVGAQFPTFLHPTTKDEYALARTEKSCGLKHTDFTVDFNPDVTNLNPQLVKSFQDLGYHLDKDYPIEELDRVFRNIIQPNASC